MKHVLLLCIIAVLTFSCSKKQERTVQTTDTIVLFGETDSCEPAYRSKIAVEFHDSTLLGSCWFGNDRRSSVLTGIRDSSGELRFSLKDSRPPAKTDQYYNENIGGVAGKLNGEKFTGTFSVWPNDCRFRAVKADLSTKAIVKGAEGSFTIASISGKIGTSELSIYEINGTWESLRSEMISGSHESKLEQLSEKDQLRLRSWRIETGKYRSVQLWSGSEKRVSAIFSSEKMQKLQSNQIVLKSKGTVDLPIEGFQNPISSLLSYVPLTGDFILQLNSKTGTITVQFTKSAVKK